MGMSPKFFILENKFYQYFDNFLLRENLRHKVKSERHYNNKTMFSYQCKIM